MPKPEASTGGEGTRSGTEEASKKEKEEERGGRRALSKLKELNKASSDWECAV